MVIGRTAGKDKMAVTIAAIDKTLVVYFQPDLRMAEGRAARNVAGTVTGYAARLCFYSFRGVVHDGPFSNAGRTTQR